MKKSIVFLTLCFLVISCKPKDQIPKNVLPPPKMTNVLWDILKADEVANYYRIKDSSWSGLARHEELYKTIYQIHHITKETFRNSMEFYEGHPDLLKPILDSVQKYNDSSMKRTTSDNAIKKPIPQ